jgi:hypothetical protein
VYGNGFGLVEVLSRHLFGGINQPQIILGLDSKCVGRDSTEHLRNIGLDSRRYIDLLRGEEHFGNDVDGILTCAFCNGYDLIRYLKWHSWLK